MCPGKLQNYEWEGNGRKAMELTLLTQYAGRGKGENAPIPSNLDRVQGGLRIDMVNGKSLVAVV